MSTSSLATRSSAALAAPAVAPTHPGLDVAAQIKNASTPARMRALLAGTWVTAALLFLVGEGTLAGARDAMKTIGTDTAPSIIAAQEISSSLADLDANAGNYLLGTKTHQAAALEVFESRRGTVTSRLVDAAANITYGEAEKVPINTLVDGLGRYLELVAEARYRKDTRDEAGAVATYGAATDLMHQSLLPAADTLDNANRGYLDRKYHEQREKSGGAEAIAGLVGALLLGLLLWTQVFLFRKMRRILSLPLVAATAIAAIFTMYLVTRIGEAREDLRVAKDDAFESIHALWKARSVAYDANGDETRYLLGGARAQSFDQAYRDKVDKITTMPDPSAAILRAGKLPPSAKGYFADELNNITFDGEGAAAVTMVRAFGEYYAIDVRMRALEKDGKHDKAVDLCIGTAGDQSNAAFDRFDKALLRVIDLNRKEFDATIARGSSALGTAEYLVPLAALAVAVLALLGLRPRLREYNA